jgi:hypothetical protein
MKTSITTIADKIRRFVNLSEEYPIEQLMVQELMEFIDLNDIKNPSVIEDGADMPIILIHSLKFLHIYPIEGNALRVGRRMVFIPCATDKATHILHVEATNCSKSVTDGHRLYTYPNNKYSVHTSVITVI